MQKTTERDQLFQTAQPVACGQSFLAMTGQAAARICEQCQHVVVNLATANPQELADVQQRLSNSQRVCVVKISPALPKVLDWLARITVNASACVLLLILLLSSQSKAAEVPNEEFPLDRNAPITPMMMPSKPATILPSPYPLLKTPDKFLDDCKHQLYTPSILSPQEPCFDEDAKQTTTYGEWMFRHDSNE